MNTTAQLRAALAEFDGRATTLLTEARARWSGPSLVNALVELLGDPQVEAGVTWLLKHELEQGSSLTPQQARHLIRALPDLQGWQAQLHLCQSVQHFTLAKAQARALASWLEPLLTHKRPFLRAWSMDALVRAARVDGSLRKSAGAAIKRADADSASVRARARALKPLLP